MAGWPMMPTGGVGQPMVHLDLRVPMNLEHMSIWTYVFQCFWALGRSRCTLVQPKSSKAKFRSIPFLLYFKGSELRSGTFKEGYKYLYA